MGFPENYTLAAWLIVRLLGIIYFFAFSAFIFQIKGLIGKNGILPLSFYFQSIQRVYRHKRFNLFPSLFWLNSSDKALLGVVWAGTCLSILLIAGIYPPLCLFLLYWLYLSVVTAGQDFLGFGWEGFLLEITANVFLLSLTTVPNILVWLSLNFLLFRFHFQAGLVKILSCDPNWRNLSAIGYHYQSQPLPNTWAWFMHKLPMTFHKLSTFIMFVIELMLPFGIFMNEDIRFFVFLGLCSLQIFIWMTGNFSFLNYLTVVLCTILLSNSFLGLFFSPLPIDQLNVLGTTGVNTLCILLGGFLLILQVLKFAEIFTSLNTKNLLQVFAPFHLANRYGIFAIMTTHRIEVIIEGSNDGKEWKEYLFWFKPSEISRRPRRISPFQPRLDWQMWFLPFASYENSQWFQNFLYHLLQGTPEVLMLIRECPFSDPPQFIRAKLYLYEFTNFLEKKQSGNWWMRKFIEFYSPTLQKK